MTQINYALLVCIGLYGISFFIHKVLQKVFLRNRHKLANILCEFLLQTIGYIIFPIILTKMTIYEIFKIFDFKSIAPTKNILFTIGLFSISIPFLFLGSKFQALKNEYPLWRGFINATIFKKILYVIIYLLYYINYEFLFRGISILLFVKIRTHLIPTPEFPIFLQLNILQSIVAGIFHYDKPLPELILAFPVSFIFGYLAYSFNSIIPCIIIHYLIAITFDFLVTYLHLKKIDINKSKIVK